MVHVWVGRGYAGNFVRSPWICHRLFEHMLNYHEDLEDRFGMDEVRNWQRESVED